MLQNSSCLVGWMPGSWSQNWTRFCWRPLRHLTGGSFRLKASIIGCRRAVLLSIYTLAFALKLRKSTENVRVAEQCWILLVASTWPPCRGRGGLSWPSVHPSSSVDREELQTAFGERRCLPSSRTKVFPASVKFESKLLVNALMWSVEK